MGVHFEFTISGVAIGTIIGAIIGAIITILSLIIKEIFDLRRERRTELPMILSQIMGKSQHKYEEHRKAIACQIWNSYYKHNLNLIRANPELLKTSPDITPEFYTARILELVNEVNEGKLRVFEINSDLVKTASLLHKYNFNNKEEIIESVDFIVQKGEPMSSIPDEHAKMVLIEWTAQQFNDQIITQSDKGTLEIKQRMEKVKVLLSKI